MNCRARAGTAAHGTTRRAAWALVAFVLMGAGIAPTPVSGQLSVDQVEIFLDPHGGVGQSSAAFTVSNEGDRAVEATVYVNDWERDDNGEHRFLPVGQLPASCGRYLHVFPLSLRLPGHSSQAVRVALAGADSLKRPCWSIIFVETAPTPRAPGREVSYITRLGVKLYVLPAGLPRDGQVTGIELRPAQGRRDLVVSFRNTGGLPLWPHGRVEFRRLDNSVASSVDVPEFPVLPGARRRVAIGLPTLPAGRYVALALIDYGGTEIAGGQLVVEVP